MRPGTGQRGPGTGPPPTRRKEKAMAKGLRWFIDSMLGYWILLLAISLGAAAGIYELWLKGRV